MQIKVVDFNNKEKESLSLNPDVFGLGDNHDILHRVINWQLAKRRNISKATKGISDVSGSNAKPFKQKGTGRSRAGSTRDSQHRGGAVIFGPTRRGFGFKIQKKVRKLALKVALSTKIRRNELMILDSLPSAISNKTSKLKAALGNFDYKNVLIVGSEDMENIDKASRNLPHVNIIEQVGANVYDLVRHDKVLVTKKALKALEERLSS